MRHQLALLSSVVVLALVISGCTAPSVPESVTLEYDFRDGAQGWESGFAEYGEDMDMQLESGLRQLPSGLEDEGTGFYLQGMNRSDDLFMFLKKGLTTADGIVPGQDYRVSFDIVFASNAPSGAVGIGGPPGEAVYLKAGATPVEPEPYLDDNDHWMLNVDKGGGNSGEGEAATNVDTIENGLAAEEVDLQDPPYVSLTRSHEHNHTVTAGDDGELWLLVGTDSGFEGLTGIYYQEINVTLQVV